MSGIRRGRAVGAFFLGVLGLIVAVLVLGGLLTSLIISVFMEASDTSQTDAGLRTAVMAGAQVGSTIAFSLLVPLAFLLSRMVGQPGRWLISVAGKVRWSWLLQCAAVSVAVGLTCSGLMVLFLGQGNFEFTPDWWWLMPMLLLLVPVQAAGMEFLLRGVLNRSAASFVASPTGGVILGAVASTAVFFLLNLPRLLLTDDGWGAIQLVVGGLLLAFLAWRTGGLEAGIAVSVTSSLVNHLPWFFPGWEGPTPMLGSEFVPLLRFVPVAVACAIIVLMARTQRIQWKAPPVPGPTMMDPR